MDGRWVVLNPGQAVALRPMGETAAEMIVVYVLGEHVQSCGLPCRTAGNCPRHLVVYVLALHAAEMIAVYLLALDTAASLVVIVDGRLPRG